MSYYSVHTSWSHLKPAFIPKKTTATAKGDSCISLNCVVIAGSFVFISNSGDMHVHYVRKSTSNIKLRRYALLTGPKRCKYLRAQIDLDRRRTENGQTEEPEMLGNGQQVILVRSTYWELSIFSGQSTFTVRSTYTKFYLKTSCWTIHGYCCQSFVLIFEQYIFLWRALSNQTPIWRRVW